MALNSATIFKKMSLTDLVAYDTKHKDMRAINYILYERCKSPLTKTISNCGLANYFDDIAQEFLLKYCSKTTLKTGLSKCTDDNQVIRFLCTCFLNTAKDCCKQCFGIDHKSTDFNAIKYAIDIVDLLDYNPEDAGYYFQNNRIDYNTIRDCIHKHIKNALDESIFFFKIQGYSSAEIVAILKKEHTSINPDAVNNHYNRTLKNLRQVLLSIRTEYFDKYNAA